MDTATNPFATTTANAPSARQVDYARTLLRDRALTDTDRATYTALLDDPATDRATMSDIITALKARPRTTRNSFALPAGMYVLDGTPVRVQKSRESDRVYAKALVDGEFVYQAGLVARVTADMRMTQEQAAAYGRETGICACCGRELTLPESVARGVGPICYSRLG